MKAYTRESAQRETLGHRITYWRKTHLYTEGQRDYLARLESFDFDRASDAERVELLGDYDWVKCDQCGQSSPSVVIVGEEPDFESHTARLCLACLKKAVEMAEEAEKTL